MTEPETVVHIVFQTGMALRVESSDIDLEFFVSPQTVPPLPCLGQANVVPKILGAEGAARLACGWMSRCYTEHSFCQQSYERKPVNGPS